MIRDVANDLLEVKSLSCVQLFSTPWTVAYQAALSMGFSRQEYWSGVAILLEVKPYFLSVGQYSYCFFCPGCESESLH